MKTSPEIRRRDLSFAWTDDDIVATRKCLAKAGFASIGTLLDSALAAELRAEALRRKTDAVPTRSASPCRYQAQLAGLGESGLAFLAGGGISGLLNRLFDMSLTPEESASCYTYYQPGDFLDPHLDHADSCTVTVILYLDVVRSEESHDQTGLELHILGRDREEEGSPKIIFPTMVDTLIVGLGSAYWHKRPELQSGEFVTALTACYSDHPSG